MRRGVLNIIRMVLGSETFIQAPSVLRLYLMSPENFVKLVVESYNNSKSIFSNKINAEDLIPPNTTDLDKSLYLFYVIQLDYATKSQRLYAGAKKLFEQNPNFFTPHYLVRLHDLQLEKYLKEYLRPRYINEAKNRYKVNSAYLIQNYNGDPRQIFENTTSSKEVLLCVRKFRGFGPKIGNFFVRTMINVFNYKYPDIEEILPPVDVHDVRIAYLLGFTDSDSMSSRNIKKVKGIWNEACKKANVSWLIFDKALWLIGSEGNPKTKEDVFKLLN